MKNAGILRAEARIELRGGGTERLLNACAEAGLPLRDIFFADGACLQATLRQSDLQRLEKTAALFQCEMRTLELRGGGVKRRAPAIPALVPHKGGHTLTTPHIRAVVSVSLTIASCCECPPRHPRPRQTG